MPSEPPVQGLGAANRWIALFDAAESLRMQWTSYHPPTANQVSKAIDSLFAYEHQLTPSTRRLARERLWLRDRPEPLPAVAVRVSWEQCRCRACQRERLRPTLRPLSDRYALPVLLFSVSGTPHHQSKK